MLRNEAKAEQLASTADFEGRLLTAVRDARHETSAPTRSAPARAWGLGGLVAATAVAAAVVSLLVRPLQVRDTEPPVSPAEGAAVIASTVESLSNGLVGSVIPSAGEIVAENPLQREMAMVYSDMRSALDFLALNFLPASTASLPESERRI